MPYPRCTFHYYAMLELCSTRRSFTLPLLHRAQRNCTCTGHNPAPPCLHTSTHCHNQALQFCTVRRRYSASQYPDRTSQLASGLYFTCTVHDPTPPHATLPVHSLATLNTASTPDYATQLRHRPAGHRCTQPYLGITPQFRAVPLRRLAGLDTAPPIRCIPN